MSHNTPPNKNTHPDHQETTVDPYAVDPFVKKMLKIIQISMEHILNGTKGLTANRNSIDKYINSTKETDGHIEIISYKSNFYKKIQRYALIYKSTFLELSKGKTKTAQKDMMVKFLNLIHAFGDNLHPQLLKELLEEEGYKTKKNTSKIINSYDRFSDNARLQSILRKANCSALEKSPEGFTIHDGKIEQHIKNAFVSEFKGIANIFNMFFYASEKKLHPESLKSISDDISRFFLEITELHNNHIAFEDLNSSCIDDDFLEKYISTVGLGQIETEMFEKLIKNRSSYENIINPAGKKFIAEIQEKRMLDFNTEKNEINPQLSLSDIRPRDFEDVLAGEGTRWFFIQVLGIDDNNHHKTQHSIPSMEEAAFEDFIDFMLQYYQEHNFRKKDISESIKTVINALKTKDTNINIQTLYTQYGYELSIVRDWVKFFIIYREQQYDFSQFKKIFNNRNGIKEILLDGFEFDSGNITISAGARYNSIGVESFKTLLEDNSKKTENGHINIKDKQYKTYEGINFFNLPTLYLPARRNEYETDYNFDDIIQFQKNSLEKINALLQGKNNIDGDYKNILKENKFIYKNDHINSAKLWSLRHVLKYAIFISEKLKKFHDYSEKDHKLLENMNKDLQLGLQIAKIKSPYRSVHKAMTGYQGDFTQNSDIVRARRTDDTLGNSFFSIEDMLNKIKKSSQYNNEIIQVIIGDKTGNPNTLGKKSSLYKDIKVHLRTATGNLIECQFICQDINQYKEYGIDITTEFLPIFDASHIKLTKHEYQLFEKTAKERNIKIPKGLQKMVPSPFDFHTDRYSDDTKIKSDFFYAIRRNHADTSFEEKIGKIESLYNRQVWNKILGIYNKNLVNI